MLRTLFPQLFLLLTAVLGGPASPTAIAATTAAPPALAAPDTDPANVIWIEGERPTKSTMTRHPWWYDQVKKEVLSGGDWISNFTKDKVGEAEYPFAVLTPDTYAFWIRANPAVGAKLDWQLDGGTWTPVDFRDARGQQNIAADNQPDMRFIAWARGGNVPLAAGRHTIRFRMTSGPSQSNHGGLDCFVFTRIPFVPAGAQQPSATAAASGPGDWFPLLADEDPFNPASVIDLSRLIPAPAGAKPASVTPCDHYGVPLTGKSVPVTADGSFTIDGTYRAYYYEVKR